jgi:hypothetical protein
MTFPRRLPGRSVGDFLRRARFSCIAYSWTGLEHSENILCVRNGRYLSQVRCAHFPAFSHINSEHFTTNRVVRPTALIGPRASCHYHTSPRLSEFALPRHICQLTLLIQLFPSTPDGRLGCLLGRSRYTPRFRSQQILDIFICCHHD